MLKGILFLVLTGTIWVLPGAVISSSAKKGLSLDYIQGISALILILLAVPVWFFGNADVPGITWVMLPLSGVANYFCFIVARNAMAKGPSGLTWAIMQSSFIMPFFMGVLFFGVSCSPLRFAGLLVMLTAMYLMGRWGNSGGEDTSQHSRKSEWLLYTFIAFVLAGTSQCFFNLPSYFIKDSAGGISNLIFRVGINSIASFMLFLCSPLWCKNSFKGQGTLVSILLLTFASLCAVSCLFMGLDTLVANGAGAIGYPISLGSNIVAFLIYTSLRLKERLALPALGGVVLCLVGIVMLTM